MVFSPVVTTSGLDRDCENLVQWHPASAGANVISRTAPTDGPVRTCFPIRSNLQGLELGDPKHSNWGWSGTPELWCWPR